ncbi:MAG: response regulator [Synergistaceae bacterium]|jgi:PAS domain S-box-containing protein|nr:response regulator [Synergistaceae bacterium]
MALDARLEQQEIMSRLSLGFVSNDGMDVLINNALRTAGEFMRVTRVVIGVPDRREGVTRPAYAWFDSEYLRPAPTNDHIGNLIAESFPESSPGAVPPIFCDDVEADPLYHAMSLVDVKSFVWAPLYVSGRIWGILSIEECRDKRMWTESDVQLVSVMGSVITGAVLRDITERKLLRLSSIVENSPQFICHVDPSGTVEYAGRGAAETSGWSPEEIAAGGLELMFDHDSLEKMGVKGKNQGKGTDGEIQVPLRRKDGEVRTLQISVFPVSAGGHVTIGEDAGGLGAIGIDVTERVRLQEELVKARDAAENSNRAKSEFLSRMSHEIRTPMNAIIGMTSIGVAAGDIERKNYCLGKITDASTHLLGVINDVLDMSKIEAGKLEISMTDFFLEKMLQRVADVVNFRMEEKNIDFRVRLSNDLPVAVVSDDQRLAQVVTNLLSNAVKFTPERGVITMDARVIERRPDGTYLLEFSVTDTGIGISKEGQAKLFKSFEQADGGISRKYGGTGLGLAISKRIVELLGGSIWVESEEGKGSSFIFRVPVKEGESERRRIPFDLAAAGEPVRILAVDDSPEVLQYFASIADKINIKCDVAATGEQACQMLEKAEGDYSIVFVDWRLPGMNGVEFAKLIQDRYGDRVAVVMISSGDWSDIEEEAREHGVKVRRFVPKPLFPSTIVDCISECLGIEERQDDGAGVSAGVSKEAEPGCFDGRRILLVEDVEINREIVMTLLSDTRLAIDTAENGLEAVEAFGAAPERYDMIFMDVHMPEMDGYQATREIRSLPLPRARTVPIVAMTANVFREDVEKCLAAGMNDHIGKPVDLDDILTKLFKYLPKKP